MARRANAHQASRRDAGSRVLTLPSLEEVRALLDADEPTPEGSMSATDLAEHWGISISSTWVKLRRLVKGGHWERVTALQRDMRGRRYPHVFYRPRRP